MIQVPVLVACALECIFEGFSIFVQCLMFEGHLVVNTVKQRLLKAVK